MNVIGISAYFHDAACCLMQDGRIVAAAEEERFTRTKHDPRLPVSAFRFCLERGGLSPCDVDHVGFYELPAKKLSRQLWMTQPWTPNGGSSRRIQPQQLDPHRAEREIRECLGYEGPITFVDHHRSHAASAYYFAGVPEAAILTVDGVGEWATTAYGCGVNGEITIFEEVEFPHSIGLLYSTITAYLGFDVNDAEYKVMGLAPYGRPKFVDQMRALIGPGAPGMRGQFALDMKYFDFVRHDRMYSAALVELFGRPPRAAGDELADFHQDVARSLQVVLEETLLEKAQYLHEKTGMETLCMAGGVALNCVANSRILRDGPFKRLFVQPAASDAGGAIGAAAVTHVAHARSPLPMDPLEHVYFGPGFSAADIARMLQDTPVKFCDFRGAEEALIAETVRRLMRGDVVGWFQGRMEFGPRALGARSILADPRRPEMRDRINALVKQREAFRPFAPVVLESRAQDHFVLDHPSPFMLETAHVRSPLDLPAITHVDGSARVQTANARTNPRLARLLEAFADATGCPILLNTSFNVRGEPIVCTPLDALLCFVRSGIDSLVLEDCLMDRSCIPPEWPDALATVAQTRPSAVSHLVYTLV
jgi:carbamoyltransferase